MSERPVTTDALETLGMIHFKTEARDAIHLAVEPVIAGEDLLPGQQIGIINHQKDGFSMAYGIEANSGVKNMGIVDPFLPKTGVRAGERFWLVVHPRQISSLRHVWEHPDFAPASN